ncbi:hypothetical protein CO005_00980 [Candidatus Roizmanbacteria bacterium CG_4_8_14_3_um_filter_34_9]|uniref:Glycosyltransferase RgtA/B/C/D-like domain-containing protein n=3 Tax=Candidatus Roizmaniibacteriota TaxID=1752723 RepID=A0A2M6YSH0_9BACT|nr:MAG: hypothetical protein COT02_05855 [Candidatus Roizmanbacteria bacterium CG07_land_8_20_14_0_80_34_15]PIW73530.1 MAG: hypothetical protein CO005_00980 [Candidatus Roizmanbacteria bacterium CG_4_8_14_3_um_filter_34_9]
MQLFFIFIIFLLWRMFDFLIIFFSQKIIPYLGFFPYADQLPLFNLPRWISALANFDGLHYINIARNGYSQYEQAFFPLYPLIIKYLSLLFSNNQLLTGLIISNFSFLIGLVLFYKYLKDFNEFQRISTIFLLLIFPTSFFFGAVYTEGLFFLLLISTLFFLKKKNYFLVFIFAFLASLTRLIGVFLIIPIFFHLIEKYQILKIKNKERATKMVAPTAIYNYLQPFITSLAPFLGLGLYCLYLWQTTGDPFFFLTSQPIFGANRSSHLILLPQVYWRYFKIFITAAHDSRFYISVIEFLIFNFVFVVLVLDFINIFKKNSNLFRISSFEFRVSDINRLGLNLFSLVNLLLPTLTGTFSSIPRYSLFSLSFFIYIAQIKSNFIKYFIFGIFVILHILLLGYFSQGYFIS